MQLDTWFDLLGHFRLQHTCFTYMLVLQAKFQEYLALSDTLLTTSIEQGSTDTLPLVRMARTRGVFRPVRIVVALLVGKARAAHGLFAFARVRQASAQNSIHRTLPHAINIDSTHVMLTS